MIGDSDINKYISSKDDKRKLNIDPENMDIEIDDEETEDKKEKFYFDKKEDINNFLEGLQNKLKIIIIKI